MYKRQLQTNHGCAVSFNPCLPDGVINELEAKWAIDHYGLDRDVYKRQVIEGHILDFKPKKHRRS